MKKPTKGKIILIFSVVFAVCLFVGIAAAVIMKNIDGKKENAETVIKSEHYELSVADVQYLFLKEYDEFMEKYANYVSIDKDALLSEQYYSEDEGITWYDYFMERTKSAAASYIAFASGAKENKIPKPDTVKKEIEEAMRELSEKAKSVKLSQADYIFAMYGENVKEENIRKCLELKAYSQYYYNMRREEIKNAYRDEDYDKYYADNKEVCEALCTLIEYSYAQFEDKEAAEAFSAAFDEKKAEAPIELGYGIDDSFGAWAFSAERKAGDTMVSETDGGFVVYCITKPMFRNEKLNENGEPAWHGNILENMLDADCRILEKELCDTYTVKISEKNLSQIKG